MLKRLRKLIGINSLEDKINQYRELEKAEKENSILRTELAEEYTRQSEYYKSRNKFDAEISNRIEERHIQFLKGYTDELRDVKSDYDDIVSKKERLFNDTELRKAIYMDNISIAIEKVENSSISKAQKDTIISGIVSKGFQKVRDIEKAEIEPKADKKKSKKDTQKDKVEKVMREFKEGKLKSSSGEKVTDKDQALAIAMSEVGISKSKESGAEKAECSKDVENVKKAETDSVTKTGNIFESGNYDKLEKSEYPEEKHYPGETMSEYYEHESKETPEQEKREHAEGGYEEAQARSKEEFEEKEHLGKMIEEHERLIEVLKPHADMDEKVKEELAIQERELAEYKNKLNEINEEARKEWERKTDTSATEAQRKAGNFKKGRREIRGLKISIENPKGSKRTGKTKDGQAWEVWMNNDYGYFNRTKGKDGDQIDVFLSDNPEQGNIYIIDQADLSGEFDEHKVMLGFESENEALQEYKKNYNFGAVNWLAVNEVSEDELKKWLAIERKNKRIKRKPYSLLNTVNKKKLNKSETDDIIKAEYQGKEVELNKPMRGDVKKYKVYVKDPKTGNIKKVNFGDPNMEIKRDDPERRKNFRARHNCNEKTDKTSAGYWSCKMWSKKPVSEIVKGFKDELISKEFAQELIIEKAQKGVYAGNAENRRLKRVGKKYGDPSNQEEEDGIEKAKRAQIGEVRDWSGKKMKKVAPDKWEEVKEEKDNKKKEKGDFLENLDLKFSEDGCEAYINGDYVGGVEFMDKEDTGMDNVLVIQYATVKEKYRGKGVYKKILEYASNKMEEDYILSDKRSEDATRFWRKYADIEPFDEEEYESGNQEEIKIYAGFDIEPEKKVEKSEENDLEKSRSGTYSDNAENRRLKRVGQTYGSSKGEITQEKKKTATDDKTGQKRESGSLDEQAKSSSGSSLEQAATEAKDPDVRMAAKKELQRREKEENVESEGESKETEKEDVNNGKGQDTVAQEIKPLFDEFLKKFEKILQGEGSKDSKEKVSSKTENKK